MEEDLPERRRIVVDGSNIATEGRTLPSLAQLDEAIRSFLEEYRGFTTSDVTVVVDASFGHRIDPSEVTAFDQAVEHGEMITPPAGAVGRGDGFILRIAEKSGALVLSNDSFQEFHAERPWLFEPGRLIGGKPVPGVGWIFTPRTPVRGARSRSVTSKSKKGARASDVDLELSGEASDQSGTTRGSGGRASRGAKSAKATKATKATKAAKATKATKADKSAKAGKTAKSAATRRSSRHSEPGADDGSGATAMTAGTSKSAKATKTAKIAKTTKAAKAATGVKADDTAKTTKTTKTAKSAKSTKAGKTTKAAKTATTGKAATTRSVTTGGHSDLGPSDNGSARSGGAPDALNEPMTFLTFVADHPIGSTFDGTVVSFTSHGAHVEVDGMLCHVPLRGLAVPPPKKARQLLAKGETRPFTLVSLDAARRRAELALPGIAS
jgi:hypothetical protein